MAIKATTYHLKKDEYSRARGEWSRILDVCCEHCSAHIAYYQKDGPGALRRMYIDRFIDVAPEGVELICHECKRVLGTKIIYDKENRAAYRLYVDAVVKRVVAKNLL